jgi:hypothetical protein
MKKQGSHTTFWDWGQGRLNWENYGYFWEIEKSTNFDFLVLCYQFHSGFDYI